MAKLFSQKPSDIALLDDVGDFGRFFFNRGIAALGRAVHARLDEVTTSSNASIAQAQRTREWDRIFGGDGTSAFADPTEVRSPNARIVGEHPSDDDGDGDEFTLDDRWVI